MKVMEDLGKDQPVQKSRVQEKHMSREQSSYDQQLEFTSILPGTIALHTKQQQESEVGQQRSTVLNWCILLASQINPLCNF